MDLMIVVEDNDDDFNLIEKKMSTLFDVMHIKYPCRSDSGEVLETREVAEKVLSLEPAIILVDFWLDEDIDDDAEISYWGPEVTSEIKGRMLLSQRNTAKTDERPIVIITSKKKYPNPEYRLLLEGMIDAVDYVAYKEDIERSSAHLPEKMCGLSEGFKKLRHISRKERNWSAVLEILKAPELGEIERDLKESHPPFRFPALPFYKSSESKTKRKDSYVTWSVNELFGWILKVLMGHPGILYDDIHAATYLGLELSSFESDGFVSLLRSFNDGIAEYRGAFKEMGRYWWRNALRLFLESLYEDYDGTLVDILRDKPFELDMKHVRCSEDCERRAEVVCHVLNLPVCGEHAYGYMVEGRPEVMDLGYVSLHALKHKDISTSHLTSTGRRRAEKAGVDV